MQDPKSTDSTDKKSKNRKRKLDDKILSNSKRFIKEKDDSQIQTANTKTTESPILLNKTSPTDSVPILAKVRKPRHASEEGQRLLKIKAKAKADLDPPSYSKKRSTTITISKSNSSDGDQEIIKKKKGKKKRKKRNKSKSTKSPSQDETTSKGTKHSETEERVRREALAYLQLWKTHRDHWKFEKLKQVWLLKNALSLAAIDDQQFQVLLDYMNSIKGTGKNKTIQDMQEFMDTFEKNYTRMEVNPNSLLGILKKPSKVPDEKETQEYDRARQIVQILSDN